MRYHYSQELSALLRTLKRLGLDFDLGGAEYLMSILFLLGLSPAPEALLAEEGHPKLQNPDMATLGFNRVSQ